MISKKLIALFAVAALATVVATGSAMATVDGTNAVSISTAQDNGRNIGDMGKGIGMGLGMGKANNNGANNGDQVSRLQAMIQQLQEQLAKLTGNGGTINSATTTTAAADLTCVKTAIDTRENAIASAFSTMTACETTALSARKTALDAAWDIALNKDRNPAINKSWQDFDKAEKTCRETYRAADKTAWNTFKTAAKSCNVNNFEGAREGRDFNF